MARANRDGGRWDEGPVERPSVLIVDDDEPTRELLRDVFTYEGFACDEAATGLEALARTARHRPSLVVLDLILPKLSGLAVGEALRTRYGTGLPILVISADPALIEQARASRQGYTCLDKPFDLDALLATTYNLLRRAARPPAGPGDSDRSAGPRGRHHRGDATALWRGIIALIPQLAGAGR